MASSSERRPSEASSSRTSSAMYSKKVSTNSGLPLYLARSAGFCVAIPTGQVSRWQTRIMMQPETTSGAEAKPYSSAPSSAPMTTSRPVFSCPSTWTTMRSRSPLTSSVCCVSASPISQGMPGVLQRGQRRRAGPAVVPRDQHDVGVRLGHPRRHRAHADLGHQLHVDPGPRVGRLEVVDELGDVLNGVDVVVRRRRNQPDARRRAPGAGDPRVDLDAGQLAPLPRLGALGDLDLQVVGVDQVLARHAEAARGHLLDRAAPQVPVGVGREAVGVLAALAGVGAAAEPVHGDGQRLVRLGRDGAVGHGAGGEAGQDGRDRLHLFDRDGAARRRLQPQEAAQRAQLLGLVVDGRCCTP